MRESDKQEVEVVEEFELLVQNEREKSDYVVFLVLDDIGRMRRLLPFRCRFVESDCARFGRRCSREREHLSD